VLAEDLSSPEAERIHDRESEVSSALLDVAAMCCVQEGIVVATTVTMFLVSRS
jgi:hypothetical protein